MYSANRGVISKEDEVALVRRAVMDGRFLLTRDRRLPEEWRMRRRLKSVLGGERG